ncbi:MAG TPA: hypothetical protein VK939_17135, partial [Longimicrobiales bacterium]|nr:hypothetical protein [Longimicrobiales bacterium]
VLLDRTESGRALRNSPLAAWLAPGSPFRAGLLESLQRGSGRDAGRRDALPRTAGCGAGAGLRRLAVNLTSDPDFATKHLFVT